jgi:hypothetical protein
MQKIILHLCADIGSDSIFYQLDSNYKVILVGKKIGVENYIPPLTNIWGIIANPVCTEFSTIAGFDKKKDIEKGMYLVNHCLRIIKQSKPNWYVIENPANGRLKEILGKPQAIYQPWQFGSPWTKKTALWGNFVMPKSIYKKWEDVPKNQNLYIRPNRNKPSFAFLHKSSINFIQEFKRYTSLIETDSDFRSLCSQGFAKAFYEVNK